MSTGNLIDLVSYPQVRYSSAPASEVIDRALSGCSFPPGQYAFALARGTSTYLVRDPIGCNKLFFGHDREGRLVVGNRVAQVWRRGIALSAIGSCPPGHLIEVSHNSIRDLGGSDVSSIRSDAGIDLEDFTDGSRTILERAFKWLVEEYKDWRFVVCLSGGLDSSVIASFAAARLPGAVAISFTYLDDDDLRRYARGAPVDGLASASDDYRCAAKVASALEMPLLASIRPRQAVAAAIGASVRLCQDWHDFNVHCATVNLFIAQDVRAAFPDDKVMVSDRRSHE